MQRSGIEWTDYTANPLRARNRRTGAVGHYCEHMSRGCQNCYAEGWNARTRGGYGTGLPYRPSSLDELELFVDGGVLAEVRGRRKPCRLFWCSMTDLALHVYSDSFRDEVLDVIDATPHITHQVLTKRPEALGAYLARRYAGRPLPASLWVGATVEDQDQADRRLPALRGIPAAVRWLSCEPLLEAVRLDLDGVRWVVVGGESGAGRGREGVHQAAGRQRHRGDGRAPADRLQGQGHRPLAGGSSRARVPLISPRRPVDSRPAPAPRRGGARSGTPRAG